MGHPRSAPLQSALKRLGTYWSGLSVSSGSVGNGGLGSSGSPPGVTSGSLPGSCGVVDMLGPSFP
jgi:hypothetical protein